MSKRLGLVGTMKLVNVKRLDACIRTNLGVIDNKDTIVVLYNKDKYADDIAKWARYRKIRIRWFEDQDNMIAYLKDGIEGSMLLMIESVRYDVDKQPYRSIVGKACDVDLPFEVHDAFLKY